MGEAKHTPGPWHVESWSGGHGYRAGFYVQRQLGGTRSEWMRTPAGRARRFNTREAALAAISKATSS